MDYKNFIENKMKTATFKSISAETISESLFPYQRDIVRFALKKGHFAIFAMTGTGKTVMQVEWAYRVWDYERKPVLIVSPLAVSKQTIREAKSILGYDIKYCKSGDDAINGINITNYEKIEKFDPSLFIGIVLDESSILKSFTGKYRNYIIDKFNDTPYKLACTATPAPNDYMELGNHAEFLNIMSRAEMLSMFFVHDGGETSKWRLKGHAESKFWEFVSTWSIVFTKPSDIGYSTNDDKKFILPKKTTIEHIVNSNTSDRLFVTEAKTIHDRRKAKRDSLLERCKLASDIVNKSDDICIVWCELNDESALLKKLIKDSVEIKGSDSDEHKERAMIDFASGKIKCLITKPRIAGFGMNWQICSKVVFASLSDSFEQFFQAERRVYRYGQKKNVTIHVIASEAEGSIKYNLKKKEDKFLSMVSGIIEHTKKHTIGELKAASEKKTNYNPSIKMKLPYFIGGIK